MANGEAARKLRRIARRLYAHLTRSRARSGIILAAACIAAYASIPNTSPAMDAVRQFFLVLSSVAAAAVLLPELSSELWRIDAQRAKDLIPDRQRESLVRALVGAESSDDDWNNVLWSRVIQPLLGASRAPWSYVRDLDYSVTLHLGRSVTVDGRQVDVTNAAVDSRFRRILSDPGHPAPTKRYWISMVRTSEGLSSEFGIAGCLARELVSVDGSAGVDWQRNVIEVCNATLSIEGEFVPLTAIAAPDSEDVVRWMAPAGFEPPVGWVRLHIEITFVLEPAVDTFPVLFSSYYCAGASVLALQVYDELSPASLTCDHFFARAPGEVSGHSVNGSEDNMSKRITFSTGPESILWPGSGVLFRWRSNC